jgi:ABC-2 type transport system ATP-binding protein
MDAIVVDHLTKKFGDLTAVDAISFAVEQGELFGFLGPNGAGKTTTINMLTTLLRPTSGSARVAGFDISRDKDAVRRHIGVVFQEPALDTSLTGRENLAFHAMMYGVSREERTRRIPDVLALVELEDKADVLVENYSGGMKRRLEIARGLIHEPHVLFLDEPTLGLDVQTRRHIWEYIRTLNRERDVTIILTSHYMEEVDYLCSRVAIVDHGRIVALDTPGRLKEGLGGDVITVMFDGMHQQCEDVLRNISWIKSVSVQDNECRLTVDQGEKRIPEIVTIAQDHGVRVTAIRLDKPSLEDVFIHYTGKSIRADTVSPMEERRKTIALRVRQR